MVDGPHCEGCVQQPHGERFVYFDGAPSSGIMIVLESPWHDEIREGRPAAGAAGYTLNKLLSHVALSRSQVIVTNSAMCRARWMGWYDRPRRWPEAALAMAHCAPHLDGLIERMRPKVLVPMGNVALSRVCGESGIERFAGYVLPTTYGIPAVPTYHPSFILRGKQKLSAAVIYALDRAKAIARDGYTPEVHDLLLDPSPEALRAYIARHTGPGWDRSVFLDLETPESSKLDEEEVEEKGASWVILRASFSLSHLTGVSFPWQPPYIAIFQELLDHANETVEWATNHFDTRRLSATGLALPARAVSALWAWHWLQSDLPKALGQVAPYFGAQAAWKHKNLSEPAYYSAMDSLEGRRCWTGTRDLLVKLGRWRSFERHCVECDPVLTRMGREGVLIDQARRTEFMSTIQGEYDAAYRELQGVVPPECRPKKFWKRPPKDMTGVAELEPLPTLAFPVMAGASESLSDVLPPEAAEKWISAIGYRYVKVLDFNPQSSDQVQALAKALRVKLPRKRDAEEGDDDATTERKYLLAPARKHRAFRLVLDCRERGKLLSTYNWPLTSVERTRTVTEHRATTVYGFHPSTLRKSSRNVNLQNIPKRSSLARAFRRMIVAAPGRMLVEADWSAIESVLVGYFARSERFMRLARVGIHGWLTSAYHGKPISLSLPDRELAALCKQAKEEWGADEYDRFKRIVHLSSYMGTPMRIAEEYPDAFPTVADARKLQAFFFETEPGQDVRRWQHEVVMQADHDGYLDNPFGYRHWFYACTEYDKRTGKRKPGDDARRAVAFRPQSTASAIQSECLLRIADEEALRLIIHDSFLGEPLADDSVRFAERLRVEMKRPVPELGGLTIGVEVSMGQNWAPYSLDNPCGMRTLEAPC